MGVPRVEEGAPKMQALDNCPFCGGMASVGTDKGAYCGLYWLVGCDTIGCRGYKDSSPIFYSEDEATRAWNRRPNEVPD